MTRNDDRHGVRTHCAADSATRCCAARRLADLAVGDHRTEGELAELLPDRLLKLGAREGDRHVKFLRLPAKYSPSCFAALSSTRVLCSGCSSQGRWPWRSIDSEVTAVPSLVTSMRPMGESMRRRYAGASAVVDREYIRRL